MRKSTVFISTVLTTFALVMIYGVVSAYRNVSTSMEVAALPENTATLEPAMESTVVSGTAIPMVTALQAAQLAAQVMGNNNLLSAESASVNGVDAYKIIFTNNDVVYVGLDGQILGVQVAPLVVNVSVPAPAQQTDDHNNGGSESHDDDEHEDHDD